MKLYVYDHCPFCVRARMPFGLKNIPFELIFLANDDEQTPIRMIGRKMLPILEDADGFMGESLDIVHKVDAISGPLLFAGTPTPALAHWIEKWDRVINNLVIPRTPDPVYPEFRTESARRYFTDKKQAFFGDFNQLKAQTDHFLTQLDEGLTELIPLLPDANTASIDHILLFPVLRSLSIVPEARLPAPVAQWCQTLSQRTGIPLMGH